MIFIKTDYSIQTLWDKKWHTEETTSPLQAAKQFVKKIDPTMNVKKMPCSVLRNTLSMPVYSLIITIKGGQSDKYKRYTGKYAPYNHYTIVDENMKPVTNIITNNN